MTSKKTTTTPIKARVLFDYKKAADDELTLNMNDIVTILDKNLEDEGWWKGELHGRIGVFPGRVSLDVDDVRSFLDQIISSD